MSQPTTRAPSRANIMAAARPMPLPVPVMTQTLFLSLSMDSLPRVRLELGHIRMDAYVANLVAAPSQHRDTLDGVQTIVRTGVQDDQFADSDASAVQGPRPGNAVRHAFDATPQAADGLTEGPYPALVG